MKYNHLNQLPTTRNELFHFQIPKKGFKKKKAHASLDFLKKCNEKQVFILERPYSRQKMFLHRNRSFKLFFKVEYLGQKKKKNVPDS